MDIIEGKKKNINITGDSIPLNGCAWLSALTLARIMAYEPLLNV